MHQITFYLDFISPYAYLAFEELPRALQGLSYQVHYKPVFLGGLLKHNAVLGPAEVPPKRHWIYRHVQWLAQRNGVALDFPAVHPFNPLGLLRLAVATDAQGQPNRYVCETLFRHVWVGGADAGDAQRLATVAQDLAPVQDPGSDAVKAQLKTHADEAIAREVFGVPSFEVDGKVFWGLDALPMLRAYLGGDASLVGSDADTRWNRVQGWPSGIPLRSA
ncbi:2-hydroxychromene-2-carboxylate isomerase [Rhodoferax sp. TS-BS-61-7]|uniref:2-hydroxychromene-2-carboxylate isomerase n=1 Tax=Rhodoferax sp. TS-BS-61-7 TaxID=2094194 RepID=UPI000CF726E8|nr:2-hydroxychromene-2-carboxylate isomerase [Rhodoferax sp. TS-BS-61-7]PQA77689.1 disulfide bond formation protein DsbA [Rhodoferax sp. TS-BS-61-7]